MSPRLASSRAAAIRWQGSKPSSLPFMASWKKSMMVWPLLVTSRMISARVGGCSSVLVWDSVANMCSTVTREGGWGQRGDGGGRGMGVWKCGLERRWKRRGYLPVLRGGGSGVARLPPRYRIGVRHDKNGRHALVTRGPCVRRGLVQSSSILARRLCKCSQSVLKTFHGLSPLPFPI